jgi:hypothetical protein
LTEYLDLADYLLIAEEVLGVQAEANRPLARHWTCGVGAERAGDGLRGSGVLP